MKIKRQSFAIEFLNCISLIGSFNSYLPLEPTKIPNQLAGLSNTTVLSVVSSEVTGILYTDFTIMCIRI